MVSFFISCVKMRFLPIALFFYLFSLLGFSSYCQDLPIKKSKVELDSNYIRIGIYVDLISHVDVEHDTYKVVFYLWSNSKGKPMELARFVDVLNSVEKEIVYVETDSVLYDGVWYFSEMMKVKCVILNNYNTENYPFDECQLNLNIEILDELSKTRCLKLDSVNSRLKPDFISGWLINDSSIDLSTESWNSNFGDFSLSASPEHLDEFKTLNKDHLPGYDTLNVKIGLRRGSWGIYFKLFLVLFLSMLLALSSLFLPNSKSEEKISIIVGALFAAVGNKYIIDSNVPLFDSFGLSDNLHLWTIFGLLGLVLHAIYEQRSRKNDSLKKEFVLFFLSLFTYFLIVFFVTLRFL